MRRVLTAIIVSLMLSGCQTIWEHPTATEADFYRDQNQCHREAMQAHPPENKYNTVGGYQTHCTGYGNTLNCTTSPPTRVKQADFSGMSRSVYKNNCLKGKGYYPKPSSSPFN